MCVRFSPGRCAVFVGDLPRGFARASQPIIAACFLSVPPRFPAPCAGPASWFCFRAALCWAALRSCAPRGSAVLLPTVFPFFFGCFVVCYGPRPFPSRVVVPLAHSRGSSTRRFWASHSRAKGRCGLRCPRLNSLSSSLFPLFRFPR